MGFKYFLKHIFKLILLFIAIGITASFSLDDGGWIMGVFLFILLFVNVSTTYDLGEGYFLRVTTGAGIGGALIGAILAFLALSWVETHIHIVIGILLLSYTVNQLIETIRYARSLNLFFTITGLFCVVMFAVETFRAFGQKESWLLSGSYEGGGGFLTIAALFLTAIFTLVNIIARATQAYYVED